MLTEKSFDAICDAIFRNGPTRVVINEGGEAVSPARAVETYDVEEDVIFIRDDGWSLGAPSRYEAVAAAMWADCWIGVMRRAADGDGWTTEQCVKKQIMPIDDGKEVKNG